MSKQGWDLAREASTPLVGRLLDLLYLPGAVGDFLEFFQARYTCWRKSSQAAKEPRDHNQYLNKFPGREGTEMSLFPVTASGFPSRSEHG